MYRYMCKQKWHLFYIFSITGLILYLIDSLYSIRLLTFIHDGKSLCKIPCAGRFCVDCYDIPILYSSKNISAVSVSHFNIINHLKLKKAVITNEFNESNPGHVCRRPKFDLKHDSVKFAFFPVAKLNCSREELFYIENGVFKLNNTKLGQRELDKCVYAAIERASDDYVVYTEPFTKQLPPFHMILKHDFIRIRCYLKYDKMNESEVNGDKYRGEADNGHKFLKSIKMHKDDLTGLSYNGSNGNMNVFGDVDDKDAGDVDDKDAGDGDAGSDDDADEDVLEQYKDWYAHLYDNEDRPDFDQLLVQVYPKEDVFQRINTKLKTQSDNTKLNVLMIGLDSMSHLAYQRKLPKTYQLLKEEMGAVIMNGYNIVGDATTAALIPMLTGETETELPDVRKNVWNSEHVDVYPLVWKKFQKDGYVTLFAEDEPNIAMFNLRLNGFQKEPTDHYMRPFWQALWDTELRKESPRYCTGNVPNHMYLLRYTQDFFMKYENVSKFAFVFGSELTHWDNNPGEYMDGDLVNLLKFLQYKGHLDNTVLIVFADHGARYSRVRKTIQGKAEERLPFMSFAFPKWFKDKHSKLFQNLIENSNSLSTPFDVHETLLDILDLRRLQSRIEPNQRGISLLRALPHNRTCASAHIQLHWCMCLQQLQLDTSDIHVYKAAMSLLEVINNETQEVRNLCMKLTLSKIHSAYLLIPNEKVLMFQKTEDADTRVPHFSSDINVDHVHFQITIETSPNQGWYESTIQVNMTSGDYAALESQVSRLDRYGKQPLCVQDKHPALRKYCYCKTTGYS